MKRQSGFTLIELVVVIVILGILAATAAPKFMNLQGDARIASLKGLEGAVKSAVNLTYSKAILSGKDKTTDSYTYVCSESGCEASSKGAVYVYYGKPYASRNGIVRALDIDADNAVENSTKDWVYKDNYNTQGTRAIIYFSPSSMYNYNKSKFKFSAEDKNQKLCALKYTQAQSESAQPKIEIFDTGC